MAFTDWNFYTSNPNFIFGIIEGSVVIPGLFTPSVIVGSGSLYTDGQGGTNPDFNCVPKFPGLATDLGVPVGRVRTLVQTEPLPGLKAFGLTCMQSGLDTTNAPVNAYACVFDNTAFTISLTKFTATTVAFGNGVPLITSAPGVWADSTVIPVELEWDASSGLNTCLCVRLGTLQDFTDLVPVLTFNDVTAPHIITMAEGLFGSGGSGNFRATWDQTRISKKL